MLRSPQTTVLYSELYRRGIGCDILKTKVSVPQLVSFLKDFEGVRELCFQAIPSTEEAASTGGACSKELGILCGNLQTESILDPRLNDLRIS